MLPQETIVEATRPMIPGLSIRLAQIVPRFRNKKSPQHTLDTLSTADLLHQAKRCGYLRCKTIAQLLNPANLGLDPTCDKNVWNTLDLTPVYHRVDTCAAEFEAHTPYLYSTYETRCEAFPSQKRKVMILGSGPNRIGPGVGV